ncbi:hypothetical protein N431DRAFT_531962, partial [Stipitochalara longipes BDJ]
NKQNAKTCKRPPSRCASERNQNYKSATDQIFSINLALVPAYFMISNFQINLRSLLAISGQRRQSREAEIICWRYPIQKGEAFNLRIVRLHKHQSVRKIGWYFQEAC